jgi:hypothetical protein
MKENWPLLMAGAELEMATGDTTEIFTTEDVAEIPAAVATAVSA